MLRKIFFKLNALSRLLVMLVVALFWMGAFGELRAELQPPIWWKPINEGGRGFVQDGPIPDDAELLTQGQLRYLANSALQELEELLPGGAGPDIKSYFTGYPNKAPANLPANLPYRYGNAADILGFLGRPVDLDSQVTVGQLQDVTRRFIDRLAKKYYQNPAKPCDLHLVDNLPEAGTFDVFLVREEGTEQAICRAFNVKGQRIWAQDRIVSLEAEEPSQRLSSLLSNDLWDSSTMPLEDQFEFVRRLALLTRTNLASIGYPWVYLSDPLTVEEPATIGQAKQFFNFDLKIDTDASSGDGLPDWWEAFGKVSTKEDAQGVSYSKRFYYSDWRYSPELDSSELDSLFSTVKETSRSPVEICAGFTTLRAAYLEELGGDWYRQSIADEENGGLGDGHKDGWERAHASLGFSPEEDNSGQGLGSEYIPATIEFTGLVGRFQGGDYDTPVTAKVQVGVGEHLFWSYVSPASGSEYDVFLDPDAEILPDNPRDYDDDPWSKIVIQHKAPDGTVRQQTVRFGAVRDPGHTAPSVGVDRDGYIHITSTMHHRYSYRFSRTQRPWVYYVSKMPWSIEGGFTAKSLNPNHEGITYVKFDHDNSGKLYATYRHRLGSRSPDILGGAWYNGTTTGVISAYDEQTKVWSSLGSTNYRPNPFFRGNTLIQPDARETLFHQPRQEVFELTISGNAEAGEIIELTLDRESKLSFETTEPLAASAMAEMLVELNNEKTDRVWDAFLLQGADASMEFKSRDDGQSRLSAFLFDAATAEGEFEISGIDTPRNAGLLYDQAFKLDFRFDHNNRMHVACVAITPGTAQTNHVANILYAYSDDEGATFKTIAMDPNNADDAIALPMTVAPETFLDSGGRMTIANGGLVNPRLITTGGTASYRPTITLLTNDSDGRSTGSVHPVISFRGISFRWDDVGLPGWRYDGESWWMDPVGGQPTWVPLLGNPVTFAQNGDPKPLRFAAGIVSHRGDVFRFIPTLSVQPCRKRAYLSGSYNNGKTWSPITRSGGLFHVGNNFRKDNQALAQSGDLIYQDLDIWSTGEASWGTIYRISRAELAKIGIASNSWLRDEDEDGLPFGLEQALGTDPQQADASSPRVPKVNPSGKGITFGFNAEAAADTHWIVKRSLDLKDFNEIYRYDGPQDNEITLPGVEAVTVDGQTTVSDNTESSPSAYYRLEAEQVSE